MTKREMESVKEDAKKLLKNKWFKWISRSFVALWLFMGCLSAYISTFDEEKNLGKKMEFEESTEQLILALFTLGMPPMLILITLYFLAYASARVLRGGSGSHGSDSSGCGGCGGGS
ncbi:MAG: hypothetical protein ACJ0K4_12210 [Verrucomicrobiales bacterium]